MATDDVHDLFNTVEDDESDDSAYDEGSDGGADDERSNEPDGPSKWDEIRSQVEEESAADPSPEWSLDAASTPAVDDAGESGPTESTTPTGRASEDGSDGFELGEPGRSSGESTSDGRDRSRQSPGTTSSEAEPGEDEFELGAPRRSAEGTPGDDGGVEPAPSTATSAEETNEGSAEFEAAGTAETSSAEASTDTSSTGDVVGDPGEPESTESSSAEELFGADDDEGETEPARSSSTGEIFDEDADGAAPAESTSSGELSEEDAEEDEREPADPTSSGEPVDGDVDEVEPEEPPSAGEPPEEDPDEPAAAESTTATREAVEEREGTADSATTSAAGERREATGSDGATASAAGTVADERDASGSEAATAAATASRADGEQVEATSPDGSGSRSVETAAAQGTTTPAPGSNRLPLGIEVLDEAMGGGVPPGRLVVLVADPGVQSELIVDTILAQRDTLYVTTDRPDWEVQKDIEPGLGSGEVVIRDHSPDSLLSGLDSLLDDLGTSSNFVLDSVNELELVPRKRYRVFLSDVKRRLFDTGSMGLLTGVTTAHESARDLTLRRADIVLRLETQTTDREIQNLLSVPKFRGGAAIEETFKLELTDEVRVDTSWNEG